MSKLDDPVTPKFLLGIFLLLFVVFGAFPISFFTLTQGFRPEALLFLVFPVMIFMFVYIGAYGLAKVRAVEEAETEQYVQQRIADERKKWEEKA